MLIRFTIENFLSFKDRQSIIMIPGKSSEKKEHIGKKVNGIKTLKYSVMFGPNASGKSNLIKAVRFGRNLVLNGNKPDSEIDFQNFQLDPDNRNKLSRMEFELQSNGKNYAYGFVFSRKKITEEWLYQITDKNEIKIFDRDESIKNIYDLNYLLNLNSDEEDKQFIRFIAKSTPDNQLLLTEIKNRKVKDNVRNIDDILNVIDWFANSLITIFPDDKYKVGTRFYIQKKSNLLEIFSGLLDYFDTGIDSVAIKKIARDKIEIPPETIKKALDNLSTVQNEGDYISVYSSTNKNYFITIENGELAFYKFMTQHKIGDKYEPVLFDSNQESDGTNRLIDFIPLLLDFSAGNKVFFIDEIERSMHPNMVIKFLELIFVLSKNKNSQLIFTSHENLLLNNDLFRKDEIWFFRKDESLATKLYSLDEFKTDFDKNTRLDYLLGRFKAVPKINKPDISHLLNN